MTSKASIMNGFEERLKQMASESYDRVVSMTDSEKGSIPVSMSRAMDYTVAVRMSKERNDLIDVANKKGLWMFGFHKKGNEYGNLESGVIETFKGGPLIEITGMNVNVGVRHVAKSLYHKNTSGGGQRFYESIQTTSRTKTYNIYKDKKQIRELINMLKELPS